MGYPASPEPELAFIPGHTEVIGPITWEFVGPAQFSDRSDEAFNEPYELLPGVDEVVRFPDTLLGATRIDSDGMQWRAIAIDADGALDAIERYDTSIPSTLVNTGANTYGGLLPTGENADWAEDGELDPPHPGDALAYPEYGYAASNCIPTTLIKASQKWYWDGDNVAGALGEQVLPGGIGQPSTKPYSIGEEGPVVLLTMAMPVYTVYNTTTVTGGDTTLPDITSPYQVVPQGTCSGTLISPDHVLTAAHCIVGPPSLMSACTDGNWSDTNPATTRVQCSRGVSVFTSPSFVQGTHGSIEYDWAIVKLETPITNAVPMVLTATDPAYILDNAVAVYGAGYPRVLSYSGVPSISGSPVFCSANSFGGRKANTYFSYLHTGSFPSPDAATSAKRHRAQGEIDAVYQKSLYVDSTHGNGYSGGPIYYTPFPWFPSVIIGVHSAHVYGQGPLNLIRNQAIAGPRVSYWRDAMIAAKESL